MSIEYVTKRNGEKEPFDINKILKWELWACDGIKQHVDWKDIIIKVKAQIYDGMSTQDIQLKLIEECNNRRSWYHSVVAGRLYAAYVSKKIHGETKPTVEQLHKDLHLKGAMASMSYTVQDYAKIEQMIDHGKDFDLSYMQVYHLTNKYSLSDRVARIQYETPQYVFMRMATALAEDEGENRLDLVDRFYKFIGGSKINAPTPNYVNLGTPLNGYISCCLYTADDTAPSLAIGDHIAFTMTYMSAGIGGFLNIRSAKDKVKSGQIRHMGKLPYYKATAGAVNASMQSSRGGASTQYFSSYDPEVLDIIYLQNPRTPIAKQNRDLHFAMQFNSLFIEKFFKNEKYFTFNKFTAPDLMDAMFQGEAKFREVYARYEADSTFKKNYVEARQIGLLAGRQAHEVSTVYFLNVDEVNHHTPFKEPILQSNLCVAPETQILTKEHGYQPIETLKDQDVHVWNGHEWSKTKVVQTGENQKLLTVMTTSGETIDATPYHKWYIKDGQRIVIKPTTDLKPGDKLVSYQLSPADHGTVDFIDGDTTVTPYDAHFTIPGIEYTVQARLKWFANLLDFFAHMTVNKRELYVVLEDYDQDFLLALKLMLQELGAHSHLKSARYQEEETWSLYISEASMLHLKGLGLQAEVLINDAFQALAQEPAHHVEILSVNDIGRTDDTYCVNEPLRHTVMFNGVLTGNCTEIVQPTKPYQRMEDLYSDELHERGEISLCALGGIVPSNIASDEEYEEAAYLSLLMVDKCIYKNKYVFPHVEKTAKARMNAAIGMIGIAYDMAKKGLKWNSTEGLQYLHFLAERHMYFLIKASLKLGKERGNAPWIHKTKWPEGWLPIDTYNKNVDTIADFKLHYDWETLRQEVIANGGIRNSVLCAFMPTESSSKATGLPNGIYPIRDLYLKKTDGSNAIDYTAKESDTLGHAYQTAYELSAEDLYKVYGVFQKFCDQAPSADIYSDRVANPKLKASRIMDELLYMYKYGVKSRYYTNSKTTDSATLDSLDSDGACAGGACSL